MSDNELTQFTNCRLIRDHALIKEDLWIRNGKICNPEKVFFDEKRLADRRIDCKGAIIAAGFIDLQINGGYGYDFSSDIERFDEAIDRVACELIKHGVTSFCPTLVTSPPETYHKILPRIPKTTNGAGVLGAHIEGPFISIEKKGAHPQHCIKDIDDGINTLISTYGSLDNVKIVTLAPEKDPDGRTIRALTDMGITVSLGHSMASLAIGEKAAQNGATLITHLFNGMLQFHHRDPGLVGLLTSDVIPKERTMYYGIISDGVHTHPAALRIAHRSHPDGLILVTDAISALGLQEGVHKLGQLDMEIKQNKAYIANTNTLCGSIAPLDECVRIFKESTRCSTVYAVESVTLHPAQCLKIAHSKGTLNYCTDADFVILNDDLNVISTWMNGKCVYQATSDMSNNKSENLNCQCKENAIQ